MSNTNPEVNQIIEGIANAPRDELEKMFLELYVEVLDYRNHLRNGLWIPENIQKELEMVFPDEIALSKQLDNEYRGAMEKILKIATLRYQFSISGAMRWPNSQEAGMSGMTGTVRIN